MGVQGGHVGGGMVGGQGGLVGGPGGGTGQGGMQAFLGPPSPQMPQMEVEGGVPVETKREEGGPREPEPPKVETSEPKNDDDYLLELLSQ